MIFHTACATCQLDHIVTDEYPNTHPGCRKPPLTDEDKLLAAFIQAVLEERDEEADKLAAQADRICGQPPPLAASAEWYVTHYRWPVFPLRPGTKEPATPRGFKDATIDLERVRAYWKRNPHANIGIPTGIAFDVIDVDVPEGIPSYQKILDLDWHAHGRAVTASGGVHVLIEPTGAGNAVRIDPGVDIRSAGGYIVAAPSWLGRAGTSWAWINKPSPAIYGKDTPS